MTLEQFRQLVTQELGERLERATPERVIAFVATVRERISPSKRVDGRFVIDETNSGQDPNQVVVDYFADCLTMAPDAAAISLWMHAMEMWFGGIEADINQRFADLMSQTGDAEPEPESDAE